MCSIACDLDHALVDDEKLFPRLPLLARSATPTHSLPVRRARTRPSIHTPCVLRGAPQNSISPSDTVWLPLSYSGNPGVKRRILQGRGAPARRSHPPPRTPHAPARRPAWPVDTDPSLSDSPLTPGLPKYLRGKQRVSKGCHLASLRAESLLKRGTCNHPSL